MTANSKSFFVTLPGRGLIRIEGDDRVSFLQGLITNDLQKLSADRALYACLLTPQGKFLHDFFLIETDGALLIECEGGARTQDLMKRLSLYRLRAKIGLSAQESVPVHAVIGGEDLPDPAPAAPFYADPRHPQMGWRLHGPAPAGMEQRPFAAWDLHRIRLGVPDGSRDLEPERSSLLDYNMDRMNAISFTKGCYVGQELTARMKHRGLAKKHLHPVLIQDISLNSGDDILVNGHVAGLMRSACGGEGLALLKDDALALLGDGTAVKLELPHPPAAPLP